MLNFNIRSFRVGLSFSFFALLAVLFYSDHGYGILMTIAACIIHESGHICFMSLYGARPEKLIFYAGGIKIIPNFSLLSPAKERMILLAGSCFNFAAAALAAVTPLKSFVVINLAIGVFNLLPFKQFDGGRLAESLSFEKPAVFECLRKVLSLAIISVGILLMLISGLNPSLAVTICYIVVSEIFC